ncbi:MAG TPA: hypothetical protein DD379_23225 [Cyanobacteria bacterium UBA11162]|nr:hypothetical protein [Cyanobacteria bacterium UBA11162]
MKSITFSPDGRTLASSSDDKTIKLWNLGTRILHQTLCGHESGVTSVAISPDGQTVASGSFDKTIKLWNLYTGKLHCTLTTLLSLALQERGIRWSYARSDQPKGSILDTIEYAIALSKQYAIAHPSYSPLTFA